MRFNLSEWALRHRSLVTYFMLVIAVAGIWSYLRLGRSEDPDFTVKTMVVRAAWPGATVADTLEQITDRIESKLQETPNLDYLKSFTSAGQTTIFVNLKGSTPPAQVPDIWYQVRKKVHDMGNTLPQGIVGPGFNDEFGDTYGIVYGFTADGFTDRALRDTVVDVRKQLLRLPDISKIDILGAQDERVYVEFSERQLAGLGIDRSALVSALQAQNAVTPAGIVQTGNEKILVRVSGVPVRAGCARGQLRREERPDHSPRRHRPCHTRSRRPGAADVPRQWTTGHRTRDRPAQRRRCAGAGQQCRARHGRDHGEVAGRDRIDTCCRPAQDR
jgi:multidrug efflux pump subunit AcrB